MSQETIIDICDACQGEGEGDCKTCVHCGGTGHILKVECLHCAELDQEHDENCPLHDDYDPTPYCSGCGSRTKSGCHCGPLAENE